MNQMMDILSEGTRGGKTKNERNKMNSSSTVSGEIFIKTVLFVRLYCRFSTELWPPFECKPSDLNVPMLNQIFNFRVCDVHVHV